MIPQTNQTIEVPPKDLYTAVMCASEDES